MPGGFVFRAATPQIMLTQFANRRPEPPTSLKETCLRRRFLKMLTSVSKVLMSIHQHLSYMSTFGGVEHLRARLGWVGC